MPQGRSVEFLYHLLPCSTPLTAHPSTSHKIVRKSRRSDPPPPCSPHRPRPPGPPPLVPHRAPAASYRRDPVAGSLPAPSGFTPESAPARTGLAPRIDQTPAPRGGVAVSIGSVSARKPTPAAFNPMMISIRWGRDRPSWPRFQIACVSSGRGNVNDWIGYGWLLSLLWWVFIIR